MASENKNSKLPSPSQSKYNAHVVAAAKMSTIERVKRAAAYCLRFAAEVANKMTPKEANINGEIGVGTTTYHVFNKLITHVGPWKFWLAKATPLGKEAGSGKWSVMVVHNFGKMGTMYFGGEALLCDSFWATNEANYYLNRMIDGAGNYKCMNQDSFAEMVLNLLSTLRAMDKDRVAALLKTRCEILRHRGHYIVPYLNQVDVDIPIFNVWIGIKFNRKPSEGDVNGKFVILLQSDAWDGMVVDGDEIKPFLKSKSGAAFWKSLFDCWNCDDALVESKVGDDDNYHIITNFWTKNKDDVAVHDILSVELKSNLF